MTDPTTRVSVSRFSPSFVWGSATSSYQIEGDRAGRGENIWDRFCAEPGRIADQSDGADGCDHVNRMADDVAMMAGLNFAAYRFSIAWPRLLPEGFTPANGGTVNRGAVNRGAVNRGAVNSGAGNPGVINEAGFDFYDRLIDRLLEAGIEPYPTLYHWDLPTGLGTGWPERETAEAFAHYTELVVDRLGDRVRYWTTLNEPFVSANHGYAIGEHAPGEKSWDRTVAASHHLLLAHGLANQVIRQRRPDAEVGIVLNFTPAYPASDRPEDVTATSRANDFENRWFVEPIAGRGYPSEHADHLGWDRSEIRDGDLDLISAPIDFLGVNYYTRQVVAADPADVPTPTEVTDMGWEIHPRSLQAVLEWLHSDFGFPRYLITENGAAMVDDQRSPAGHIDDQDRIAYLRDHLHAVARAIDNGVPIDGYLVWSLLDNFEWAFGYEKTFGIVEVDRSTMARIPKASAHWFAEVAKTGIVS